MAFSDPFTQGGNDPFGGVDMTQRYDAELLAQHLGQVLGALHVGNQQQAGRDAWTTPMQSMQPADTSTGDQTATAGASTHQDGADAVGLVNPSVSGAYGEMRGGGPHPGIDLAVPVGTPLVAAEGGVITVAGNADPGGYGNYVEIRSDNGVVMRYGHLSAVGVQVGQRVKPGDFVGKSGGEKGAPGSGNSEGAHLHFEVRIGDHTVDPVPYLAGGAGVVAGTASENPAASQATQQAATSMDYTEQQAAGDPFTDQLETKKPQQGQAAEVDVKGGEVAYYAAVLKGIGAPVTPANLAFMRAWKQAEGGDDTNPFDTTQGAPGATDFNSVGVKRYASVQSGIQATIQTLTNGNYGNILQALKAGTDPMAAAHALAASPWGTGQLVEKILGGGR